MRAFAALAIYVSLATGLWAEGPPEVETNPAVRSGQPVSRARLAEARAWLEHARVAWASDPAQSVRLAVAAADLANMYRAAGDYPAAERLLRDALAAPSCDARVTGLIRNNLADLLREEGRAAEAEPLFQQSLAVEAEDAPDEFSRQRTSALIGLADIDRQYARWDRSLKTWNEALEISHRENDRRTEAIALRGLGITWLESGSAARAEPLLRRSLRIMEDDPETPGEMMAGMRSALGELYRLENKLALAEGEWSRALEIDRMAFGEVHPQVAWLLEMLSDVLSARGEFHMGRVYATQASEMMRASFGEDSIALAGALANLALVENRAGELDAAAKDYEQAIRIARTHPEHRPLQAAMVERYAGLLKAMRRGREAKALLANNRVARQNGRPSFALK